MSKKSALTPLVIPKSPNNRGRSRLENSARNKNTVQNLYRKLIKEKNLNYRNYVKGLLKTEILQKILRSGQMALNRSNATLTINQKREWAINFLTTTAQLEIANINKKMNNFKTNPELMNEDPFVWMSNSQLANFLLPLLNPIRVR